MIKNVYWSLCKVPVVLVRFSKNNQISNSIKIRPLGAELFHADGQADGRDKGKSRFFSNFVNSPKSYSFRIYICTIF